MTKAVVDLSTERERMPPEEVAHIPPTRVVVGLFAGVAIAAVDNVPFAGEVSPIVIVALLLAATGAAGAFWGWRAWVAALSTCVCLPSAHLVKHLLRLPDTLHPNTYASILTLAAFSLAVATVGMACGALLHGLTATAAVPDSSSPQSGTEVPPPLERAR